MPARSRPAGTEVPVVVSRTPPPCSWTLVVYRHTRTHPQTLGATEVGMGKPSSGTRDLVAATPPVWAPVGRRWAVLVGISSYRDPALNLQFADRDATELRELL